MRKALIGTATVMTGLMISVTSVFAHVSVKPNQAGAAAFQTFTVGVPNEKDNPTVGLRLLVPEGLKFVSPNVKPGWAIQVKKTGEKDAEKVTEIVWTGGSIPAGQRDDFAFSAQVPSSETTLNWKAYQTYEDGAVVSWDQDPALLKTMSEENMEKIEKAGKGPFSQTKIVNDLKDDSGHGSMETGKAQSTGKTDTLPFALSIAALALSLVALARSGKRG